MNCQYKKCTLNEEVVKCDECKTSYFHVKCFLEVVEVWNPEWKEGNAVSVPVCGKRCYNKQMKNQKTKEKPKKRVSWHNDGPNASISSMSILVGWFACEGNYVRWKGGDKHSGATKGSIASEISRLIKDKGIQTIRSAKDIITKIAVIERQYKDASDFLHGTGAGVQDEESLKQCITKRCPPFYELESVMGSRATTQPLAQGDDLLYVDVIKNKVDIGLSSDSDCVDLAQASPKQSAAPATAIAKQLSSVAKKRKSPSTVNGNEGVIALKQEQLSYEKEYKAIEMRAKDRELDFQERLAAANIIKLDQETRLARINATSALLLKRKELKEAGIDQSEIDCLLPLV